MTDKIRETLFSLSDKKYRDFQSRLLPTVDKDKIIGVRTPQLRQYAKEIIRENKAETFLKTLPHKFFDENQLHAFIISDIKDYDLCIKEVDRFLPYIDNWATCDQLSPKAFKKHHKDLIKKAKEWIASDKTYTIRFGIGILMQHFLDADYKEEYPRLVAKIRSEEYYINMMIAWYFATALAKQYDSILPFIENRKLDTFTHNKAIQKAVESYRITDSQKEHLKSFKIKHNK